MTSTRKIPEVEVVAVRSTNDAGDRIWWVEGMSREGRVGRVRGRPSWSLAHTVERLTKSAGFVDATKVTLLHRRGDVLRMSEAAMGLSDWHSMAEAKRKVQS